ncbi:molybdopterin-binding protein [Rhodovarius crocodyli]|uniref:Molybdopterin-binding protein n=1 Tax=Rhodovarius crocodyli TaxID=1979269 RepID=A0A437M358_9PROT|nr:molybdopterin-dependent oxidoreductase [Rhodovarius crocodyli]RVT92137.1 molybdopterin-binding protein [Rhodovarius crocodyli]
MNKPLLPSRFRPALRPDPGLLEEHAPALRAAERRMLLRGSLSLGALAMLGGCSTSDSAGIQAALRAVSRFNDRVQAWLFDPNRLAPTYPESMVLKPPRFNAFYDVDEVVPVEAASWRLELSGRVAERQAWDLPRIMALPESEIIIRHICVEGWDYIGQWSGVPLRLFLERVGADTRARYVAFRCADGYWGSIDMATALHPQTLLATKYARQPMADPFGFPLRLRTATKLGFKNPKWITSIEVTNTDPGGFWEDRGFNWFSGL